MSVLIKDFRSLPRKPRNILPSLKIRERKTDERVRGESHIDFRTQCVIITLARVYLCGEGRIANDVLEMRTVIEFQSS